MQHFEFPNKLCLFKRQKVQYYILCLWHVIVIILEIPIVGIVYDICSKKEYICMFDIAYREPAAIIAWFRFVTFIFSVCNIHMNVTNQNQSLVKTN